MRIYPRESRKAFITVNGLEVISSNPPLVPSVFNNGGIVTVSIYYESKYEGPERVYFQYFPAPLGGTISPSFENVATVYPENTIFPEMIGRPCYRISWRVTGGDRTYVDPVEGASTNHLWTATGQIPSSNYYGSFALQRTIVYGGMGPGDSLDEWNQYYSVRDVY